MTVRANTKGDIVVQTEDRRVRRTKRALQEALAELLQEKGLSQITVQELADKADVHRGTFYSHYSDIYDLYQQMEAALLESLTRIVHEDPSHTYAGVYNALIAHVQANAPLYRVAFQQCGPDSLHEKIVHLLKEKYLDIVAFENGDAINKDVLLCAVNYHINGCAAILEDWVLSGMSMPVDMLEQIIRALDLNMDGFLDKQIGGRNALNALLPAT